MIDIDRSTVIVNYHGLVTWSAEVEERSLKGFERWVNRMFSALPGVLFDVKVCIVVRIVYRIRYSDGVVISQCLVQTPTLVSCTYIRGH